MEGVLANYLKMTKIQQVIGLLAMGWSFRRIQRETGVHRETAAKYARQGPPNPAKVFPGSSAEEGAAESNAAKVFAGSRSSAARYDAVIRTKLSEGLTAQRIFQDLQEEHGYAASYESIKRYVRRIEPVRRAVGVMHSEPGEEALCGVPHRASYAAPGNMRRPPTVVMWVPASALADAA